MYIKFTHSVNFRENGPNIEAKINKIKDERRWGVSSSYVYLVDDARLIHRGQPVS